MPADTVLPLTSPIQLGADDGKSPLRKVRRRLVRKHGEFNIYHNHLRKRGQRFLADIFTTLVDCRFRYILLIFIIAFYLSWILFAIVWYIICYVHGDFEKQNYNDANFRPCVTNMINFASALLMSIETQHTIGYGSRATTVECPEAIFLMMTQSCYGVILQAFMAGLVFVKLTRPKKRTETLLFSKNAVVNVRNGKLCLMYRIADMRQRSHLVDAHVRAYLIRKYQTEEGEVIPLHRQDLNVGFSDGLDRVVMDWPTTVTHEIDESSPLWELNALELEHAHFEIMTFLEATIETTGMAVQARSSYVPEEILWGHRFESVEFFNPDSGRYVLDFDRFHNTVEVHTPTKSAKLLSEQGCSTEDEENHVLRLEVPSTRDAAL